MKAFKKLLALALVIVIALSAVSCSLFGKGSDSEEDSGSSAKKTKKAKDDTEEATVDENGSGKKTSSVFTDPKDTDETSPAQNTGASAKTEDDKTEPADTEDDKTEPAKTEGNKTEENPVSGSVPADANKAAGKLIDVYNVKSLTFADFIDAGTNGFLADQLKTFFKDALKIEDYSDAEDELQEGSEANYEYFEENFGSDFRCTWEAYNAETFESPEEDEYVEDIADLIEDFDSYLSSYEALDDDEKAELAETVGGTVSDIERVYNDLKAIVDALNASNCTDGYVITGYATVTGSELESPNKSDNSITVLKIDGIWVAPMGLSQILTYVDDIAEDLFYWSI